MAHVDVNITWNGTAPTAVPDTVLVKLSHGHDRVKWTSGQDFIIDLLGNEIRSSSKNGVFEADSVVFSAPALHSYGIRPAAGPGGGDPQIDIQS